MFFYYCYYYFFFVVVYVYYKLHLTTIIKETKYGTHVTFSDLYFFPPTFRVIDMVLRDDPYLFLTRHIKSIKSLKLCPDRSFQFFTRHSYMNPYSFLIASMKRHSSLNPNCGAMEIKIKSNRLILLVVQGII
ncbi:hypothetical protein HanPI659440_Chr13g0486441 [Helianthus annuus]|nr:hypothetical protein HanPI659440_Chr13g0486441 [Helianthus annuus]